MVKNEININLAYKKDGRINQARISLQKEILDFLKVTPNDRRIKIQYEDGIIKITKVKITEEVEEIKIKSKDKLKFFQTAKEISFAKSGLKNNKYYYSYKLFIPLPIVKELGLIEKNSIMELVMENNKLTIKKKEEKMGNIYTIKVNKGGIGKTFITLQLGAGLAIGGKKTLLLTSDSQNNILDYSFPFGRKPSFKKGLKEAVKNSKDIDLIKLRENLYTIPLESNKFSRQFLEKLPIFLEEKRKEYDYILIDSIPTMKLDSVFVKSSDKIIIPCYCDRVTVEGTLNVIEECGVDKVHSIIVNRLRNTSNQKRYLKDIEEAVLGTGIIFPDPIKELSGIETLLEKGKNIWETEAKSLENAQDSLIKIIKRM